jgi:hypothetical protein
MSGGLPVCRQDAPMAVYGEAGGAPASGRAGTGADRVRGHPRLRFGYRHQAGHGLARPGRPGNVRCQKPRQECRGCERFRMVSEAQEDEDLKKFYKTLWTSEAKHGNIFVELALEYFEEKTVYDRLHEMMAFEGEVIKNLPVRAALH